MPLDRAALPDPLSFHEAEGTQLRGTGPWLTGRCPMHGGRSLRVRVDTGAFACMGGCLFSGGDLIAYVMLSEGRGFIDACKRLGAWRAPRDEHEARADKRARNRRPSRLSADDALVVLNRDLMTVRVALGALQETGELSLLSQRYCDDFRRSHERIDWLLSRMYE